MARNEQHIRRCLEYFLRPVAVMDIEIDDGDPPSAVLGLSVAYRHGSMVQQAKTHRRGNAGMVSGRAHGAEGILRRAGEYLVDGEAGRAAAAQRGFDGAGGQPSVRIERNAPGGCLSPGFEFDQLAPVGVIVDPEDLLGRGPGRWQRLGARHAVDRSQDRGDALHALGVVRPGIVPQAIVMVEDQGFHRVQCATEMQVVSLTSSITT